MIGPAVRCDTTGCDSLYLPPPGVRDDFGANEHAVDTGWHLIPGGHRCPLCATGRGPLISDRCIACGSGAIRCTGDTDRCLDCGQNQPDRTTEDGSGLNP